MEAVPKVLSGLMCRSIMNPSKLEWATLPLNARSGVRRGQVFLAISVPWNWHCGCMGKENQKPVWSEPAAKLSMKELSGLVIQYEATVLSEGSRVFLPEKLVCLSARGSSATISPFAARLTGTHSMVG